MVVDQLVTRGDLIEKLHEFNAKMAEVSPTRVRSIIEQTIRKDTQLVKALKALSGYRCQFPNCNASILKRNGEFYVEVSHVLPVHKGGKSVLGNLLVLCPKHHKEFDYGKLEINKQTVDCIGGRLNGKDLDSIAC